MVANVVSTHCLMPDLYILFSPPVSYREERLERKGLEESKLFALPQIESDATRQGSHGHAMETLLKSLFFGLSVVGAEGEKTKKSLFCLTLSCWWCSCIAFDVYETASNCTNVFFGV